jgi:hypothetical protein
MSRDRDNGPGDGPKLRLVRDVDDASREHAVDDEALAAELGDELPGSQLADDEVHELIDAVRAAGAADEIDPVDHEALLVLTLGDPIGEIDERERAEAEALRQALDGDGDHPLAQLAGSLRAAQCDRDIDQLGHERIVRRVVTSPGAGRPAAGRPSRSVWLGALAALAAGVALFFGAMSAEQGAGPTSRTAPNGNAPNNGIEQPAPPSVAATLIQARSTQELFDPATPFAKKGGESKRLDVIARARAADLRANRFAAWGVR